MSTTEAGNEEDTRQKEISAEFPFESNFVEVNGADIHYVDAGEGDPVLFLHGNPTWSYLWRNIIPHLQPMARCIAPDLIGMGKSDKPDIAYTFEDHYEYIEAFIDELGLEDITLVVHDWGSGIGFHYAHTHRGNVTGIAFMEAIGRPGSWDQLPRDLRIAFRLMRTPVVGWLMISVGNMFVNRALPDGIVRDLTDEEFKRYKEPYPTVASRKPVRVWPLEVPLDGTPARVHDKVAAYSEWLTQTDIPKLYFHAQPGMINQDEAVEYIENNSPIRRWWTSVRVFTTSRKTIPTAPARRSRRGIRTRSGWGPRSQETSSVSALHTPSVRSDLLPGDTDRWRFL